MPPRQRFHRPLAAFAYAVTLVAVVSLTGCDLAKNQLTYDRSAELDRQDYRDALAPQPLPPEEQAAIPDFEPMIATPEDLRLPSPLVTVSVNNTVSLRDLMFELADQADIDLELDPQIRGSVIFTAKDRPFDEVVSRLCEMAGLRYTFEKNVLRVELDRPYIKNYKIDYINVGRSGNSSMTTSLELGGGSGGGEEGGGGASTSGGSTSEISTTSEANPWDDLTTNIEQILTSSDTYISLSTLADPVPTPVSIMPPAPVPAGTADPAAAPPPLPGSPQVSQMAPAVAPTLQIAAGGDEPQVPNPPATYSVSQQTGILSVFASERQHKQVQKFLDEFRQRVSTQVLIEAKILQVDLSDEFATGIDWSRINFGGAFDIRPNFPGSGLTPSTSNVFSAVLDTTDINVVATAISRFGTVRALSSPRVTVLNNQPAIVNVAQSNVYFSFEIDVEEDSDTNEEQLTIDSEQLSTPEGVILNVTPQANIDTGEIMLSVRPTVSRITSQVADPTIPFFLLYEGRDPEEAPPNNIPEVSVQEIDSLMKLQSGQVMVMGGLMRDTNTITERGLPVAGDLPIFGNLFKSKNDTIEKSELVILIKAQIVAGNNADDMDRKIYKGFSNDRRPVRF